MTVQKVTGPAPHEALVTAYLEDLLAPHPEVMAASDRVEGSFQSTRQSPVTVENIKTPAGGKPDPGVTGGKTAILPPDSPPWGGEAFAVTVFQLGHLPLAAVANQLQGTLPLKEELVVPSGLPESILGSLHMAGTKVWVVDTSALILPGKKDGMPYQWMLLSAARSFALACNEVRGKRMVTPDKVRWRPERTTRPWLLGMLDEVTCPLIDVEKLVEGLALESLLRQ